MSYTRPGTSAGNGCTGEDRSAAEICGEPSFWQAALDSLAASVAILDRQGNIVGANAAWRQFGSDNGARPGGCCIGTNYLEVCERASGANSEEAHAAAAGIREVIEGQRHEFALSYPCHAPTKKRWFMLRVTRFEGPGPGFVTVAHEDATAPKAAELKAARYAEELERANATLRLRAAELERAEQLEADRSRILSLIAANELLGTVLHEIALMVERQQPTVRCGVVLFRNGKAEIGAAPHLPPEWTEHLEAAANQALAGSETISPSVLNLADALAWYDSSSSGREKETGFHFVPVRTQPGQIVGSVAAAPVQGRAVFDNATLERAAALAALAIEHMHIYERLSFQANHDALTELPNRLLFQDRLQQVIARARRDGGSFAVLMIDLDRFRQISDVYGQLTAEALLRRAAQRITFCVRQEDTVARLGGDQFAAILQAQPDTHAAEATADRISAAFQAPFVLSDRKITLTCSVGISIFPNDAGEAGMLVRNAGSALREAKRQGRNTKRRYNPDWGTAVSERADIERHLPDALQANELSLEYQPQVDQNNNLVGVEALMRWNSPVLGRVPPTKFIAVAEDSGLILEVGAWGMEEACRQNVAWQRAGLSPIRVSVNVSPLQLCRPDFAESVLAVLVSTGLDPAHLELEVTESAMMHGMENAVMQLSRLRGHGIRVAIDDFGTGYSSLSYIQALPVDTVKVDRSFVRHLDGSSPSAASVVQAIISMAHDLNLSVVAEGVETKAQLEALKRLNCDVMQGFLLHKPLPAAHVASLLDVRVSV